MLDFKNLVKDYYKDALDLLLKDCSINSIYDESTITKEHPYGEGVAKCFELLKEVALKDGFKVDMCDGHCLEIECGEGDKLIYIFAHQDVVPVAGQDWDNDPFTPVIKDERIYARGTSDDKGPGIASYFALKALKDAGLIKNFRVRLVFGGDEERGSSCLEYYFHTLKKEDPTYGFTPDGDFPLIYGEKGITNYWYEGHKEFEDIVYIKAGTVLNTVIDKAEVKVKNPVVLDAYLRNHTGIKVNKINDDTYIFLGKSAHGSTPELGENAGVALLSTVGSAYNIQEFQLLANEYVEPHGKNMYVYFETENLHSTTYNVGKIEYENGLFRMGINFRYPENVVVDEVISKVQECSPFPIKYEKGSDCLYFDPETPFIKALANVYVEETGDTKNKPMTIGGGTYAKEAKNTIAFGSNFPGKVDHIHEENEKIDLEDFYNSMSIYAHAIYCLGNLD